MMGLRSGEVRLEDVHAEAVELFNAAEARIASALPAASEVEHVGSTAVSGLIAKPIVDIVVGVPSIDEIGEAKAALVRLGYRDRGWKKEAGGHILDWVDGDVTTQHLHVTVLASLEWRNYIDFRDRLKTSAQCRRRYEMLKKRLARIHERDRRSYTDAKASFVLSVLQGTGCP
jgi:GrpB-like predicted nucleotidyltransferase (UPF0157 family)